MPSTGSFVAKDVLPSPDRSTSPGMSTTATKLTPHYAQDKEDENWNSQIPYIYSQHFSQYQRMKILDFMKSFKIFRCWHVIQLYQKVVEFAVSSALKVPGIRPHLWNTLSTSVLMQHDRSLNFSPHRKFYPQCALRMDISMISISSTWPLPSLCAQEKPYRNTHWNFMKTKVCLRIKDFGF